MFEFKTTTFCRIFALDLWSLATEWTQEFGSIKFVAILFCRQSAKITTFLLFAQ